MYRTGHVGINILLYSPILFLTTTLDLLLFGLVGLFITAHLASLPDIDLSYKILKHRGFTHTTTFGFLVGLIFGVVSIPITIVAIHFSLIPVSHYYVTAIILGSFMLGFITVINHIIGDVITPSGVRPFKKPPLVPDTRFFTDKRYTLSLVYAKNQLANGGFLLLGTISIGVALYAGGTLSTEYAIAILL